MRDEVGDVLRGDDRNNLFEYGGFTLHELTGDDNVGDEYNDDDDDDDNDDDDDELDNDRAAA